MKTKIKIPNVPNSNADPLHSRKKKLSITHSLPKKRKGIVQKKSKKKRRPARSSKNKPEFPNIAPSKRVIINEARNLIINENLDVEWERDPLLVSVVKIKRKDTVLIERTIAEKKINLRKHKVFGSILKAHGPGTYMLGIINMDKNGHTSAFEESDWFEFKESLLTRIFGWNNSPAKIPPEKEVIIEDEPAVEEVQLQPTKIGMLFDRIIGWKFLGINILMIVIFCLVMLMLWIAGTQHIWRELIPFSCS